MEHVFVCSECDVAQFFDREGNFERECPNCEEYATFRDMTQNPSDKRKILGSERLGSIYERIFG